jgi:hypothetical protein
MKVWLRRLLTGKSRWPDDLLTAVVGPQERGGWSLFWVGDGISPKEMQAWTLTELVNDAFAAVVELYARFPVTDGAELQFAIYPWACKRGPMFEIAKQDSLYVARDELGGGHVLEAISLERLIGMAEPNFGGDSMFHWIRPVASSLGADPTISDGSAHGVDPSHDQ